MAMISYRGLIMNLVFVLLPVMFDLIHCVDAGKENNYCNVCRAVVVEANWKISQSDPKKMIQVGSFRVDPQGNQNIKEKSYARSEGHVEEIFETVCDELKKYAKLDQEGGSSTIVRTTGRHGERLETKDHNINWDVSQKLRYQCHDFLEDHEEDVMRVLQREDIENYEQVICGAQTNVCSGDELSFPMIELSEAIEDVDEKKDPEEDEGEDFEDENEFSESEQETDKSEGVKDEL